MAPQRRTYIRRDDEKMNIEGTQIVYDEEAYKDFRKAGYGLGESIEMAQTVKLLKEIACLPVSETEESARDIRHTVGDALKSILKRVNGNERDENTCNKERAMDSIQERIGKIKNGYALLANSIADYSCDGNCGCDSCADENLDKAVSLLERYDYPLGLFEWSNMMNEKYRDEMSQGKELSLVSIRELSVKYPDFLEVTKLDRDEMIFYLENEMCNH